MNTDKEQQINQDFAEKGDIYLDNYGISIRAQPRVGPAGFKAASWAQYIVDKYPEQSMMREDYIADEAETTEAVFNALVIRHSLQWICVVAYYLGCGPELKTLKSERQSVEFINQSFWPDATEDEIKVTPGIQEERQKSRITRTDFRRELQDARIRIGMGFPLVDNKIMSPQELKFLYGMNLGVDSGDQFGL